MTKLIKNIYFVLTNVAKNCSIFYFGKNIYMNFIKDSIRELKHVVWPTKEETNKYFIMVLTTLIVFGIYLAIANFIFESALFSLHEIFKK